nr:immunoglobulin heavy chain junction region [Macaca mulatta]
CVSDRQRLVLGFDYW